MDNMMKTEMALPNVSTGFQCLDKLLGGLRPAEVAVLASRPGVGKTMLALSICANVARGVCNDGEPQPVAIFSCEMSRESLALRLPQVYVDDTGNPDVMELWAKARQMKERHGIKLVVIDYLQLLHSRDCAKQGRQKETASICTNLKAMAQNLQVPVLLLSQLSRRSPKDRGNEKPQLSDLRDSEAIEQEAGVVLLLRRPCMCGGSGCAEEEKNIRIVDVAKNRNGLPGEVALTFIPPMPRSDR